MFQKSLASWYVSPMRIHETGEIGNVGFGFHAGSINCRVVELYRHKLFDEASVVLSVIRQKSLLLPRPSRQIQPSSGVPDSHPWVPTVSSTTLPPLT